MADFEDMHLDDIDSLLSNSLKKAAEPANSAGVADAIRARVSAGDTGASVAGPTAPGWTPPRPSWLVPLASVIGVLAIALIVVLVIVLLPKTPEPTGTASPTPSPTLTATPTPTPTPTPTETEDAPPPPPPPRDTTSPKISVGAWSSALVYDVNTTCDPRSADITVQASDNDRVADVSADSSTPGASVVFVSSDGSSFTFRFTGTNTGQSDVTADVTFTAIDDAGNTATASRSIDVRSSCIVIG